MMRSSVDLPAPLGPVTVRRSPSPMAKEISSNTGRPPRTEARPVPVSRMAADLGRDFAKGQQAGAMRHGDSCSSGSR